MRFVDWLKSRLPPTGQFRDQRGQRLHCALIPDLWVTQLETRQVLNGDGVISELVFDAGTSANDGEADIYQIEANDGQVDVTINGVLAGSASINELQKITINGSADVDIVIADFSSLVLNNLEITFNGFDGNDSLKIIGDHAVDTVSYSFNQMGSGVVTIGSGQNSSSIIYGDIANINQTLSAGTISFEYGSGNGSFTLSDAFDLGDTLAGQSRLDFTRAEDLSMGWADPFVVTFQNPLDQFVLDTRSDMTLAHHADSIEVVGLDGIFNADLVFHGDADDSLRFTGAISTGHGDIFATAGTIELEQAIIANDATFEFTAIGNLTVGQNGQISNVDGSVLLRGANIDHSGTLVVHRGIVELDSGDQGVTIVRGIIDVSGYGAGQTGGEVRVLGMHVGLADGTSIDASGASGGGTVLIGGDFQGENLAIRNASRTYVNTNAAVHADAILDGNGGKVAIWADDITRYFGSVSVRGGQESGDGGFVEVSGKAFLIFQGTVNTSAPQGNRGTLLLDPLNITITNGDGNVFDNANVTDGIVNFSDLSADTGDGTTGTSEISQTTLESLASDTDVILSALNSITVEDLDDNELTLAQDNLVIFNVGAGGFVMLGAETDAIRVIGTGSLSINAVASGGIGDGEVSVGALHTNGGNIFIEGTLISLAGDISTDGGGTSATAGSVTLIGPVQLNANLVIDTDATDTDNNIVIDGTISGAHALTLLAGTGSVSINGDIGSNALVALSDVEINADSITIGGTVEVTGDLTLIASELSLVESSVGGNLSVTATNGNLSDSGTVTVGGSAIFTTTKEDASIDLDQLAVTGSISVNTVGLLGHAVVVNATDLNLGTSTVGGNLSVTATNGNLSNSGTVTVEGDAIFTTTEDDASIDLDQLAVTGSISVNTVGPLGHATLENATNLNLGASTVGGDLSATAADGDITSSGAIIVGGNSTFTANGPNASITVDDTENAFAGSVTFAGSGGLVNVSVYDTTALELQALTLSGDLTVTAAGITDSGVLTVGGKAAFSTIDSDQTIDLDTLAVTGTIRVTTFGDAGNVLLVNTHSMELAQSDVGGNLIATSTGGNLIDSGTITVGGSAIFTTEEIDKSIELSALAVSGVISVNTLGDSGHVTIVNTNALDLGTSTVGGNLTVTTTTGNLSDSGTVSVGGDAIFTTTEEDASIDLDQLAVTGSISVNTVGLLGHAVVVNATDLNLGTSTVGGNLNVTATNDNLSNSGTVTVDGDATFTTTEDNASIYLDQLAVTGSVSVNTVGVLGHAVVVNATDLNLGASTVGGDLSATVVSGDISSSGAIIVDGNSTFTANGPNASITVDDTENAFAGSVTFAGSGGLVNVSVYDTTALELQALTLSGNLTVTAAGITDIGLLVVDGNAVFSTTGTDQTIDLDTLAVTGSIGVATFGDAGDVLLVNTLALELAISDVGGNLIATSTSGNLTGNDAVTVGGTAIFTTQQMDASIELSALAVSGSISVNTVGSSGHVALVNTIALDLATSTVGGNLIATSTGGDLTDSGMITVGGSAAFSTTTSDAMIDLGTLAVTGSISVNTFGASGHASLINETAVDLAAANVGGNLNVTAVSGNLTDSGLIVVGGSATFTTLESNAEIELDSLDVTGSVSVNTVGVLGHATVENATDLNLGASTVGGDLNATAADGDITSSGAIIVGGNSTFTANGTNASITVADTGNVFEGSVTFAGTGTLVNVSVYDSTDLELQALTLSGDLTVTAAGITDSGLLVVHGNAVFSTTNTDQTIELDTLAVTGTIGVATFGDAGDVLLVNTLALELAISDVGGNLIATSTGGNLTGNDTVKVGGTAIFTTEEMDASIELSALAVSGSISVNTVGDSGHVAIINASALDLATSTVGGNLTAMATNGNLSDSGTVSVGGSAIFTTAEDDASIDLETLMVTGSISVNTKGEFGRVNLVNATDIELAASDVGGDMVVTAMSGNLTDSGLIVVGGGASFTTAQSDAVIILDTLAVTRAISVNTTGPLGNATLTASIDLELGTSNVGGDLIVTSTGGDVLLSGTATVGGDVTINVVSGSLSGSAPGLLAVVASALSVETANGVNVAVDIDSLDVRNSTTGNITVTAVGDVTVERLQNLVNVDLVKTTGTIDVYAGGTMTIAESGFGVSSVDGDIHLEANRVEVHAAVTTSHTGDVWIVSNAGPTIFGADGDLTAQEGVILVDSFGLISMTNDTVFRTDSGQVSGTLLNSPNPVATSTGTPLSDSNRLATIDVDIQDPQSNNVKLEIDWLEGQTGASVPVTSGNLRARLVFAIVDGTDASPMVQFSHTYDNAPDPANPGIDFDVSVRIVDFAANTIRLNENGATIQSKLVTTATVSVEAPLLPFFPQLPPTAVLNVKVPPVSTVLTSVMSQRQLQSDAPQPLINSVGIAVQETQRYYVLRIVTFGVEGEIKLIQEGQEFRLTNLEDPDSNTGFELSQLPELFKRLPDNRYRIFLIDGQTERLVLDFIIQEGQPIEAAEDVGVENESDKVRNERGDRDGSPAAEQRSEKPVIEPKPRDDNDLVDEPDDAVARLGSMPVFSSGGVLFAAGMTSNWSIHRGSNSIDLAAIKVKARQTRICRNPGP